MRAIGQLIHNRVPYKALTVDEIELLRANGYLNGYGGNDIIGRIICFLIWLLAPILKRANPDYHDYSYLVGWDEARRKECDDGFLNAMEEDLSNTKYSYYYYRVVINIIYYCVRKFGSRYFNYR